MSSALTRLLNRLRTSEQSVRDSIAELRHYRRHMADLAAP